MATCLACGAKVRAFPSVDPLEWWWFCAECGCIGSTSLAAAQKPKTNWSLPLDAA